MLKRLHSDADSPVSRRVNYSPPTQVQKVPIFDLIKDSPRSEVREGQLELLHSIIPTERDAQISVFVAGDTSLLRKRCVAIIGTREVTDDGAKRARRLAKELVETGVVVVSGLAHGVDTYAMTSAIENGGRVVGVIGTPMDQAYPAKNAQLQETVYREHLLISQFPIGARVFQSNFPSRNRTMAMLSDASVIIEASDSSGTLHQAAECVRLKRWLCIARSVVENKDITWPARFLSYEKCVILKSTAELLDTVYGK